MKQSTRSSLAALVGILVAMTGSPARAQDAPSWIIPDLAAGARNEGSLTIYSSMNEQEGLPLWKMFEDATGVKVSYVRSSDSVILSRIAIESRARQRSWDIAVTTTVNRLPNATLIQFDPPQAAGLKHDPGQALGAAEVVRGIPGAPALGRQGRARRHRRRMVERDHAPSWRG